MDNQKRGFLSSARSALETKAKTTISSGKTSIICLLSVPRPMTKVSSSQRTQQCGFSTAAQNNASAPDHVSNKGASIVRNRFRPALAGVSKTSTTAMNAAFAE